MWGISDPREVLKEMGRLKQIGFNHVLGLGANVWEIWKAGKPTAPTDAETVAQTKHLLDEALANDMTIVATLTPASMLASQRDDAPVAGMLAAGGVGLLLGGAPVL